MTDFISLNVYQYVLSPSVLPVFNESWGYPGHKMNSQARGSFHTLRPDFTSQLELWAQLFKTNDVVS